MNRSQRGQALVEGIAALLILLSLWVAIPWLARLQDMALQASHASRYAAFSLARSPDAQAGDFLREHYFSGAAHRWSDLRGHLILPDANANITLKVVRDPVLPGSAQPGGAAADAQRLRQGWRVEDGGVATAYVAVRNSHPNPQLIQRYTAILAGAGHAAGDVDVQQRVAASPLGWGHTARASIAAGRHIEARMRAVDQAWGRPEPDFDWLGPWSGEVPRHHLSDVHGGWHAR